MTSSRPKSKQSYDVTAPVTSLSTSSSWEVRVSATGRLHLLQRGLPASSRLTPFRKLSLSMWRVGIGRVYPSSFRTLEILYWNIHPLYCPSVRGIYPWLPRYHQANSLARKEKRSLPVRPSSRNKTNRMAPVIELLS